MFDAISAFSKANKKVYVQITLKKDFWRNADQLLEKLFQYKGVVAKVTPILEIGVKDDDCLKEELVLNEQEIEEFIIMYKDLKLKYGDKLDDSNLTSKNDYKADIEYYSEKEWYHISDSYICVRPDGTKSFSYDLIDPYTFGNALDGLDIDIAKKKSYCKLTQEVDERIYSSMNDNQHKDIGVCRSDILKKEY